MMGSSGRRTHPVIPASAMDAPITFRKPRRETESTHSDAPLGNSRCSASWNAGLPASSSRLRQYSGPALSLASSICARRESTSSLPFLEGQTSSRLARPSSSSIFIGYTSHWLHIALLKTVILTVPIDFAGELPATAVQPPALQGSFDS